MLYSQREHVEEITDERWYKTIKKEVYDSLGVEYFHVGDYKKALKYYQLALSIAKDTGDKRKQACAYGNLGIVYCELGDLKKAEEYYQQCLSIAKDAGDHVEQAHAYGHLGNIHCTVGNFKTAMEYCQQSLSIAEHAGDKRRQGEAYGGLASIHFSLGDFNKAFVEIAKREMNGGKTTICLSLPSFIPSMLGNTTSILLVLPRILEIKVTKHVHVVIWVTFIVVKVM